MLLLISDESINKNKGYNFDDMFGAVVELSPVALRVAQQAIALAL